MENINFIKELGDKLIEINPQSEPTYFNPLEIGQEANIEQQLDENIIPMLNIIAKSYNGFRLSGYEENKIREIIVEAAKDKIILNPLSFRNELIKHDKSNDLSRVIDLINLFL